MNNIITLKLVRMIIDFIGKKEWNNYSKQEKIDWIVSYRKVEEETNKQIELAGSVENWYASGQGRLLQF